MCGDKGEGDDRSLTHRAQDNCHSIMLLFYNRSVQVCTENKECSQASTNMELKCYLYR